MTQGVIDENLSLTLTIPESISNRSRPSVLRVVRSLAAEAKARGTSIRSGRVKLLREAIGLRDRADRDRVVNIQASRVECLAIEFEQR